LVSHCNDTSQRIPPSDENLTKVEQGSKMFHVEHIVAVDCEAHANCFTWNIGR
jgi:hypothetical protein